MDFIPVILAGGLGRRLAPHSTPEKPKAFLERSQQTLLETTLSRFQGVQPRVIVLNKAHLAHAAHIDAVKIAESQMNGTAFAIALAALHSIENAGGVKILICPCDHEFGDKSAFADSVSKALNMNKDAVLFGVAPKHPNTQLGYIERGDNGVNITKFHEKPDQKTAERYFVSGRHFWNAGIFLFDPAYILEQIQYHALRIYEAAYKAWQGREQGEVIMIPSAPQNFEPLSIDYAVLEKAKGLAMVEIKTHWRDLGTPEEFFKEL